MENGAVKDVQRRSRLCGASCDQQSRAPCSVILTEPGVGRWEQRPTAASASLCMNTVCKAGSHSLAGSVQYFENIQLVIIDIHTLGNALKEPGFLAAFEKNWKMW